MAFNQRGTILFRLVAILLIGGMLLSVTAIGLSSIRPESSTILPGFEGEQNGINGYQVGSNQEVTIGNTLPTRSGACSYAWGTAPSITSASVTVVTAGLGGCGYLADFGSDTTTVDAQENPIQVTNPFTTGQTVNYYVRVPGSTTQWEHVTGQVEVYTFYLDFSIQAGSADNWDFGGDTTWFNLLSVVWNQASTDPTNSSISGSVFETPLYAVVSDDPTWQNQGTNQIDAAVKGHAFTFYSAPYTQGQTLASLANPTIQNVNYSLGSQYSPDSRFQRLVYYPVSFISWHNNGNAYTGCSLGCSPPSVKIPVTLYTLRIGEYILTNPDKTTLSQRQQSCTGLACISSNWGAWWSNPLNQILAAVAVFLTVMIVVVVILLIFAPELLLFLVFNRRRGKG